MRLLVSGATKTVERFQQHPHLGHLISPQAGNSMRWITSTGLPWAADNGAFSGFDAIAFERMLEKIQGRPGCLFVVCPDVVADAKATLDLFSTWQTRLQAQGLPVAYVAQDGQENLPLPWNQIHCLFLGGSTKFKLGRTAESLTRAARERGKLVHMGRVNSQKRMRLAKSWGCHSVDGTGYSRFPDQRLPSALNYLTQLERQYILL
ncbi:MAG: hypothetical protein KDA84_19645 [Planctomycetaceae bacterium]|nr:hypothetical protein [Planctomycetaceae bacterium]